MSVAELTLLHSEQSKLHRVLAILSATGLKNDSSESKRKDLALNCTKLQSVDTIHVSTSDSQEFNPKPAYIQ